MQQVNIPTYRVRVSFDGGPLEDVPGAEGLDYFEALFRCRELKVQHRGRHVEVAMETEEPS